MSLIAISGCDCMCPLGTKPSKLMATSQAQVLVGGRPACTIRDVTFMEPVGAFGVCNATFPVVKPCACAIPIWIPNAPTILVGGVPVLTVGATALCPVGPGAVQVISTGQAIVNAG